MRHCLLFLLLFFSFNLSSQTPGEKVKQILTADGNPMYEGNEVTLLPSAREKYADLFDAIGKARRFVHLEYFIFYNDSIGNEFLDLLARKVAEGVEIRVLVDAYGNYKGEHPLRKPDLAAIRGRGIKIDVYDKIRFPWIQNMLHRDHRKIVVIDGEKAYTGGMNIADYYLHGTERTGPWRDMQIRLEGPVVNEFESIFARIWEKTTGEHLDSLHYRAVSDGSRDNNFVAGDKEVIVVNREPHALSKKMRRALATAIDAAEHEIRIVNPYPTNVRTVRRAMKRALNRGVKLKMMVSYHTDNRLTPDVIAIQMKKLMNRGAEIYYFDAGFHHSKTMTIDKEFCNVGTVNLDGRSLLYDYEVSAFVFDKETTAQIDNIFDKDIEHSEKLTPENFKKMFPRKRRVVGRLFQPLKSFF